MARSYRKIIDEGIDRTNFIEEQEAKASKRRPRKKGLKPKVGTLFSIRNKRLAIREGANRKAQLIITYKKTTTGEQKKYTVNPYSYRYKRLKGGLRKMLYAYDTKDKHIKGFSLKNIRNVALTDRKFRPKWPIEI